MHHITSLMVAFLLHLSSQHKLDIRTARKIQETPSIMQWLIMQFVSGRELDWKICMQDAIDEYIKIVQKGKHYE